MLQCFTAKYQIVVSEFLNGMAATCLTNVDMKPAPSYIPLQG